MGRLARANAAKREMARSEVIPIPDRCPCGGDHWSNPAHWEVEEPPAKQEPPSEPPTSWKVGHMRVWVDKR